MTRDGKGKPTSTTPPGDAGPLLSANALYREFNKDSNAALGRHAGKMLVLEGRRGTLIELSDGGAAIHIADGFTSRALVLVFRDLREVSGISEGAQFRFQMHRGELRLSVRPPGRLLDRPLRATSSHESVSRGGASVAGRRGRESYFVSPAVRPGHFTRRWPHFALCAQYSHARHNCPGLYEDARDAISPADSAL